MRIVHNLPNFFWEIFLGTSEKYKLNNLALICKQSVTSILKFRALKMYSNLSMTSFQDESLTMRTLISFGRLKIVLAYPSSGSAPMALCSFESNSGSCTGIIGFSGFNEEVKWSLCSSSWGSISTMFVLVFGWQTKYASRLAELPSKNFANLSATIWSAFI